MQWLQRLSSETPETSIERDERLHQMRLNQWQRLAIETSEVREACLQQMRLKL